MSNYFLILVSMGITSFVWGFQVTPFLAKKLVVRCRLKLSRESYLPFQECWDVDAAKINPLNDTRINTMLQRLCSPAPQSYFIVKRFLENRRNSDSLEDDFSEIQYLLKPGYRWKFNIDHGHAEIIPCDKYQKIDPVSSSALKKQNTLDLAHEALNIASKISLVKDSSEGRKEIKKLVEEAKERLQVTLGTDIRGRTSTDAAFSFALAGVDDTELYRILAIVTWKELERVGKRPSFHSRYILQVVEKLAAAGLRDDAKNVHRVATNCLEHKGEHLDVVEMLREENSKYDLISSRPLLWLWRFSSRQTKVKKMLTENTLKPSSLPWLEGLDDLERPLVVDVGCGMGVSLLGLATTALLANDIDEDMTKGNNSFLESEESLLMNCTQLMQANYVGCDLSQLATGYAQGVANRWDLGRRVQFSCQSAQDFLEEIEASYPGEVSLVLIQFPSPFKFRGKADVGNSQLPMSSEDGFLACTQLFHAVASVLRPSRGYILLQSNVEDVAVVMRNTALTMGFESVPLPNYRTTASSLDKDGRLPQRTADWIRSGGERAVGDSWSAVSLLPPRGATETEVSCDFLGTHVHRCLLRAS